MSKKKFRQGTTIFCEQCWSGGRRRIGTEKAWKCLKCLEYRKVSCAGETKLIVNYLIIAVPREKDSLEACT